MRKIREVLRLRWEFGHGIREIARSVGVSHSTVIDVLRRAKAADLSWPVPGEIDDQTMERMLYPVVRQGVGKPEPDWGHIPRIFIS